MAGVAPISRLAKMQEEGAEPTFPPNSAPYLVEYMMEIGPVEAGGMEASPIGWSTIKDWQQLTGVQLEPWQARLIRRLSISYLDQSRKARAPECPSPWIADLQGQRASVDAKLRARASLLRQRSQST